MVGESWDVFPKRLLVEKHINGIMFENPVGTALAADVHGSIHFLRMGAHFCSKLKNKLRTIPASAE